MMDFEKIILTRFEIRILRLFKRKSYLNYYQIHGFFNFPSFESVLRAVHELERLGFVQKRMLESDSFQITRIGEDYLRFIKKERLKRLPVLIGTIAAACTILGFLIKLGTN